MEAKHRKETPILFQPWKIRRMMDWDWSRHTMQTRRLNGLGKINSDVARWGVVFHRFDCPYGKPGDLLWVREALSVEIGAKKSDIECGHFTYKTDDISNLWTKEYGYRVISPIFMPKFATRIWLEIVSVRLERLSGIGLNDIEMEAVLLKNMDPNSALEKWIEVWDSVNAKRGFGWNVNPYVWVIEFRRVKHELR